MHLTAVAKGAVIIEMELLCEMWTVCWCMVCMHAGVYLSVCACMGGVGRGKMWDKQAYGVKPDELDEVNHLTFVLQEE